MPESDIYICSWKKIANGYTAELLGQPNIRVFVEFIEDIKEELTDKILQWNGDGEAIVELLPPIGGKTDKGIGLYSDIGYNNRVDLVNPSDLYEEGFCSKCHYSIGSRSKKPLEIRNEPKGAVVGVMGCYPIIQIYSKAFVNLISVECDQVYETLPVMCNGKETEYLEIIPKEVIKKVGCKEAIYPEIFQQSWRCNQCGRIEFQASVDGISSDTYFLSANDLGGTPPEVLFVDTGMVVSFVIRNDLWERLAKKKETKGCATAPVIVLGSENVEDPVLPEPEVFDWI